MKHLLLIAAMVAVLGTLACERSMAQTDAEVTFEVAFENLTFEDRPLLLLPGPEADERRLYVVEQIGRITSFPNDPAVGEDQTRLVLDISEQVRSPVAGGGRRGGNEEGLLGFAFHPDVEHNRRVFLHYSAADNPRRGVISEWTLRADGTIDPESEHILLEVEQPWGNHNGGHIEFGPDDGYLYITLGDGGSGGDPLNSGQDTSTLLGNILRIDVDHQEEGRPYAIPADNPFVDDSEARDEIYVYGLRNVWRFSFDPETGAIWAADVGQNAWEEVNVIEQPGGNYGWNIREGTHDYDPDGRSDRDLIDPIHEYPNPQDGVSITGGYVYRGEAVPAMQGAYIFGDYGHGTIWMLRYDPEAEEVTEHEEIGHVPQLPSFGLDHEGELYACSFDGQIYKMRPAE